MGPPPRPLPPAAAHAFVADVAHPVLDEVDLHHFQRVLRLRPGQAVTVSDGAGRWRLCAWRADGELEPTGPEVAEPAPEPVVSVAFALTKGERPEWVVQKLTEVGVDRVVPFRAARSVVQWDDDKASAQVVRWRRVARQAAMQSRRAWLAEVAEVVPFTVAVEALGGGCALADSGGGPPSLDRPSILIGPEGGWADAERDAGLPVVGLGATVLRAETAAVAAGVLLCGLRDGTITPAGP